MNTQAEPSVSSLQTLLDAPAGEAMMLGVPGLEQDTFPLRLAAGLRLRAELDEQTRDLPPGGPVPCLFGLHLVIDHGGDAYGAARDTVAIRAELISYFGLHPTSAWHDGDERKTWIYENPAASAWITSILTGCARSIAADMRRGDGGWQIPNWSTASTYWQALVKGRNTTVLHAREPGHSRTR